MELKEEYLDQVFGGVPYAKDEALIGNPELFRDPDELTETDLDNVTAGHDHAVDEDKALENEELFRHQKIEELKSMRDEMEQVKEDESITKGM